MDYAGASRILHAVRRLLGVATLVALLAAAYATGPAQAQFQPLPDDAPDQTWHAPDGTVDPDDWDDRDGEPDHDSDGHGWPDWPDGVGSHDAPQPDADTFDDAEPPAEEELPAVTSTYVAGTVARLRTDGKAAIPRGAPKRVRSLIARYNRIVGKRYKWGGGHMKLADTGYDCSGAVGYGLIKNGLLRTTMVSGSFARWGAAGTGRWVTVYAHKSHVYIELAGLRLDTSPIGDRPERGGVRWRPPIGQRRGFNVRHPVGL